VLGLTLRIRSTCCLAGLVVASAAAAQPVPVRTISLEEAITLAQQSSESIAIARAGVTRAAGQRQVVRSGLLPQLTANLNYVRTLRSQFEVFAQSNADPNQPSLGSLVGRLPFGQTNQYTLGLALSQTIYRGPLVPQARAAEAAIRTAEIDVASARAQLTLDVAQAYYDAALGDRLVDIARATLRQAETTLRQTSVAFRVGTRPEFDVLRSRVAADTQRPVLIQQQAQREIAYVRLKQLLQLPPDTLVALADVLDARGLETTHPVGLVSTNLDAALESAIDDIEERAPIRQALEALAAREQLVRAADAERLPAVSLSSQYDRLAYPITLLPFGDRFVTNWTVVVGVQLPLFTGGRISGERETARANAYESRFTVSQARKLAALDTRDALARLVAADAIWTASSGTVEQATRAFEIGLVRFNEGVSTQLELVDTQLLLQQAQANRAGAARDLQLARLRVQLLRDLPLGANAPEISPLQRPAVTSPGATTTPAPRSSPQPLNASTPPSVERNVAAPAATTRKNPR
jgi:outer membrane protein TolC